MDQASCGNHSQTSPFWTSKVKRVSVLVTTSAERPSLLECIKYFSDWHRTKKPIAICVLFIEIMKFCVKNGQDSSVKHDKDPRHHDNGRKQQDKPSRCILVRVEDLQRAELLLVKAVQYQAFPEEIKTLENKQEQNEVNGIVRKLSKRSCKSHTTSRSGPRQ